VLVNWKSKIYRPIYFDVEMRTEDEYPALVGVLVDEEFTITCLEEGLRPAAEHAGLEVVNPHEFFTALLLKAEEENRALVAYTLHEFEILEKMFDENSGENKDLLDILNRRYVNANARKWFRKHYRESYDMIEARERAKGRRSKYRKKNGGIRMGLNLLLQIPEVAYPGADEAGRGSPANALRDVRDHLARKGPHIDSLTSTVKGKWTRMLTYLEHDVRGMAHLVEFMNNRHSPPAMIAKKR
jgi:hypothetical protein